MAMKTSAVWADGTFSSNTAPLMGSLDDCARRASDLGYDALSLTVKDPNERDWVQVLRTLQNCGLEASGLATGRVYTVDGLGLGMADADRRRAAVDRMLAFLPVCAELGKADHRRNSGLDPGCRRPGCLRIPVPRQLGGDFESGGAPGRSGGPGGHQPYGLRRLLLRCGNSGLYPLLP